MEFLLDWLGAIWVILVESGPYLLVGFLIAGFLKVLIPEQLVYRHLGQDNMRSVGLAALFGAPIPLCSCSVIPTAISLKRSGASKGATSSFLISTPETGVDSIGVTWALMDPVMTIVRPLAAIFTALGCGALVNKIVKRGWDDQPEEDLAAEDPECCHHQDGAEDDPAQDEQPPPQESDPAPKVVTTAREATRYAFGPLMADLTPWFILGFLISGLITLAVPDNFFGDVLPTGWLSMLSMLVIGVPLYICATASTPVAAALIAKGLDPGSALVLLLAGPATNIATIAVVRGFLGRRVLYAYLFSIAVFSLGFGSLVNLIYGWLGTTPQTSVGTTMEHTSALAQISGLILLLLMVWHARRLGLLKAWGGKIRRLFLPLGVDLAARPARICGWVVVLLLYLSTAVSPLGPGQTGFLMRFGKLVEVIKEPGAVWHAPFPLARLETVSTREMRALRLGQVQASTLRNYAASSEVMTADEYILNVAYSVHYKVDDAQRFLFSLDQQQELLEAAAESSLRVALIGLSADQILVGRRQPMQNHILQLLQSNLDALETGMRVQAVHLDEVHAPQAVHYAFRNVASSLEDKQRLIQQAEAYRVQGQAQARAAAAVIEENARADSNARLQEARAAAAAFRAKRAALAADPAMQRYRLQLQTLIKMLANKRLVLLLDSALRAIPFEGGAAQEAQFLDPRTAPSEEQK